MGQTISALFMYIMMKTENTIKSQMSVTNPHEKIENIKNVIYKIIGKTSGRAKIPPFP